jgi:hypothetical protein
MHACLYAIHFVRRTIWSTAAYVLNHAVLLYATEVRRTIKRTAYFFTGKEYASLRKRYAKEFAAVPELAALAEQDPPAKRTKAEAVAAGNRVLSGKSTRAEEAFYDVDLHTARLWYHDKIKHSWPDSAHQYANVIKQTFKYVLNKKAPKKVLFSQKLRDFETKVLGRFQELRTKAKSTRKLPPWAASKASKDEHSRIVEQLQTPSSWAAVRDLNTANQGMKTSEHLLLAGPAGKYLLRHFELQAEYKRLFIELLDLIQM